MAQEQIPLTRVLPSSTRYSHELPVADADKVS